MACLGRRPARGDDPFRMSELNRMGLAPERGCALPCALAAKRERDYSIANEE
jgi:hypothetical protein